MRSEKQKIYKINIKELENAKEFMSENKVGLFIVAYNAQRHIEEVLSRVPEQIRNKFAEVYIIDDSSMDNTIDVAINAGKRLFYNNLKVLKTPFNRGYGGNQKLGYLYAIAKKMDFVILLHGDGQYPPEFLPQMINTFREDDVAAVFASRMINRLDALKGGMPFYKWVGNQILTLFENIVLKASLSEFHTGYRAYRVSVLEHLPFSHNSNDFHFDTEIIIQLIANNFRIKEFPIPTHYGDEVCHVNGMKYALNCVKSVIKYKLTCVGLFYEPKFDFKKLEETNYYLKHNYNTLHQFVLNMDWKDDMKIVELGARRGELSSILAEKVKEVVSVDEKLPEKAGHAVPRECDLNKDFDKELGYKSYDAAIILDVIEHLHNPEEGVKKVFNILRPGGYLYASTANIAFFITRLSLLMGWFNYGKVGILDLTHTRLFTVYSFKKLLINSGFIIKKIKYFGPPVVDMVGDNFILRFIDSFLSSMAGIWPSVFAYNFLVTAERMDDLNDIYENTFSTS